MHVLGIEISFELLRSILGQWGYLIVFLLAFLETSAFVGLVVPGETIVILAAAAASQGVLDPYRLAAVVCTAAVLGDSAGYFIGRRVGREFILRHPRLFRISKRHMEKADGYFARHGGKTIFFGRWIGFLRSLAPLLAGSARMSYPRFLAYDLAGAISWGVVLTALGFFFGKSYNLVEAWLGRVSLFLLLLFGAAALLWLLGRWLLRRAGTLGALAAGITDLMLRWRPIRAFRRRFAPQLVWVFRRFSPSQAYGLGLTLGLLIMSVLVWAFALLTQAVLARTPLVEFDRIVAVTLHQRTFPRMTQIMLAVTFLGSGWVVIPLAGLVAALLIAWRRRWLDALVLVTSAGGAVALAQVLKLLVQRSRPDFVDPLVPVDGYSFPSGHATTSAAFFVALAVLGTGWVRHWESRAYVLLAALAVVILIGFSRLYLGAHYLTDVLAGFAAGAFWATICITAGTVLSRARGEPLQAPAAEVTTERESELVPEMPSSDCRPAAPRSEEAAGGKAPGSKLP